jgi:hypothetical protein
VGAGAREAIRYQAGPSSGTWGVDLGYAVNWELRGAILNEDPPKAESGSRRFDSYDVDAFRPDPSLQRKRDEALGREPEETVPEPEDKDQPGRGSGRLIGGPRPSRPDAAPPPDPAPPHRPPSSFGAERGPSADRPSGAAPGAVSFAGGPPSGGLDAMRAAHKEQARQAAKLGMMALAVLAGVAVLGYVVAERRAFFGSARNHTAFRVETEGMRPELVRDLRVSLNWSDYWEAYLERRFPPSGRAGKAVFEVLVALTREEDYSSQGDYHGGKVVLVLRLVDLESGEQVYRKQLKADLPDIVFVSGNSSRDAVQEDAFRTAEADVIEDLQEVIDAAAVVAMHEYEGGGFEPWIQRAKEDGGLILADAVNRRKR